MGAARCFRKVRRKHQNLCAPKGHKTEELSKPQVIADAKAQSADTSRLHRHDFMARC